MSKVVTDVVLAPRLMLGEIFWYGLSNAQVSDQSFLVGMSFFSEKKSLDVASRIRVYT